VTHRTGSLLESTRPRGSR